MIKTLCNLTATLVVGGTMVAPAAGFFGPQLIEGAENACHAVEKVAIREGEMNDLARGLGSLISGVAPGAMAETAAHDMNPDVPVQVTCALRYWGF